MEQIAQVSWAEREMGTRVSEAWRWGLWRSPPLSHPLTLSGKLPREAAVGRQGQKPGGGVPVGNGTQEKKLGDQEGRRGLDSEHLS